MVSTDRLKNFPRLPLVFWQKRYFGIIEGKSLKERVYLQKARLYNERRGEKKSKHIIFDPTALKNERGFSIYSIRTGYGKRFFHVPLASSELGLRGVVDELVVLPDGTLQPVDYKMATTVAANHRLQVAAYALLLEQCYQQSVEAGFVYLIPKRQTVQVSLTERLRQEVLQTLVAIRALIQNESMPPPPSHKAICRACEFRRFCNDTV